MALSEVVQQNNMISLEPKYDKWLSLSKFTNRKINNFHFRFPIYMYIHSIWKTYTKSDFHCVNKAVILKEVMNGRQ
jgi:hypothetical protein